MSIPRVYVDSGVLILASQAKDDAVSQRAIEELDRDATFIFSTIVEIETLPATIRCKFPCQEAFFRDFFSLAERVECTREVQDLAFEQACSGIGLGAADALHVACAITGGADELLTREKSTKPLPLAVGIPVRTISYD